MAEADRMAESELQAEPQQAPASEAQDASQAGTPQLPSAEHSDPFGSSNLELIFDRVGHLGRFQLFLYFVCAIQNMSCGIHYLASVFLIQSPKHACKPPGNVSQILFPNISSRKLDDAWLLLSTGEEDITVQLQNDGYFYDKTEWDNTMVTQWDLVCNQEWFALVIQPVFMTGVLLGGVMFGYLADRMGRRLILWFTSAGIYLFGIASALSFDYYSFLVAHFCIATVTSGYLVVMFVYVMEFVGRKYRTWAAIQAHSFFAVGTMTVAVVGYFTRTWRVYLMVLSTVTVPFILCCWMLPETPYWLLLEGQYEEAQKVIDSMAKWNRKTPCNLSSLLLLDLNNPVRNKSYEAEKHKLLNLFYDWNIGTRTLIVWLMWFTVCWGYYTFDWHSVELGGNEYLNLFLVGIVEIPAYFFVCVGMDSVGRRNLLIILLLLSALLCGVMITIPESNYTWVMVLTMSGKFTVGAAFGLMYFYTAELYPTIIRSLAVGTGSMVSHMGTIITPFSLYLSNIWIFMPQLIVGVLTLVSGLLALKLPETLGNPLITTWEEAVKLDKKKIMSSDRLSSTTNNSELEKIEAINSNNPGFSE